MSMKIGKMDKSIMQLVQEIKKRCSETDTNIDSLLHISQAEHSFFESSLKLKRLETTAIAQQMGLSPSRFSRVVDKMVQNNYIERVQNPNDRRAIKLSFTPKGRRVRKKLEEYKAKCDCNIEDRLSQEQIESIKRSLGLLLEVM